jgi:hypothetical protein
VWARIHKLDKVRPLAAGGAIVLIEDERTANVMGRVPSLSTLVAIARVLAAQRALDAKFDGKGEVRYVSSAMMPHFLSEAITHAGAAIADRNGDHIVMPAQPSGIAALIDVAFAELAHHARGSIGVVELGAALEQTEQRRRTQPLDRDKDTEKYWPAVLELAALAGEQARKRGGRWIDTRTLPVGFGLKFPDGAIAHPTVVAQTIVEGVDDTLATQPPAPSTEG